MNILGHIAVSPTLPERIERLEALAYNLWWSWTASAQALWIDIDPTLWEEVYHNPIQFLRLVSQEKLDEAAQDRAYLKRYDDVMSDFDSYIACKDTWFERTCPPELQEEMCIAYFSAEFGLHESLPIYSGGLGILSGDHCKAASDLGLPFVGVGFLYPQGYFEQRLDATGNQHAVYNKLVLKEEPALPATHEDGSPIMISVELPGRTVSAQVWTIQVGRITLLMLDTDVDPNAPSDRELAARLYGGDDEMRISQEIILGIGGVRALEAMGYKPTVWHMNEGHSAFLGLERVRKLVQGQGLDFKTAVEAVRASSVFTTHTPVPAGNDAFPFELVERYFYTYWPQLGIGRDEFLALAHHQMEWGPRFSMTVLALQLSSRANGVSELHGQVSRTMWKELWPETPVDEVPITHVTNGVHHPTWTSPLMHDLFDQYLDKDWRNRLDDPEVWAAVREIPDEELEAVRRTMKQELVTFVRQRLSDQYHRLGLGPAAVRRAEEMLDPDALIIGFARRFATYKRATLLFRDMERITTLMADEERPIYVIFAGKAHPADEPGKALIRRIFELSQNNGLSNRVIFLEDYDMNVARHMLAGVDIWLNNPRRPLEASGTSGEKAAMNGAPNLSVLDGWWREGYDGKNGWAIGQDRSYDNQEAQDEEDALSLYGTLEDEIVPLFYGSEEQRAAWWHTVKESIATITPQFNMQRMVKDYTTLLYIPAGQSGDQYVDGQFGTARTVTQWKNKIRDHWHGIQLYADPITTQQAVVGESLVATASVRLNSLQPEDVAVELVLGRQEGNELYELDVTPMEAQNQAEPGVYRYKAEFTPDRSGRRAYGVRVRPNHPALINPMEVGKVKWA